MKLKKITLVVSLVFVFLLPLAIPAYAEDYTIEVIKEYYDDGVTVSVEYEAYRTLGGSYIRHGYYKTFYSDSTPEIVGRYYEDKKDGSWTRYFANGKKSFEGSYKNGLEEGTHTYWWSDGTKASEGAYSAGLEIGIHREWYFDGQIERQIGYSNGIYQGTWTEWYEDGQMKFQGEYRNGKEEGIHRYWYDTGYISYETSHKEGVSHGLWTKWYNYGNQMEWQESFSNGIECGTFRMWSSYGELLYEVPTGISCSAYEVKEDPYPDPEVVPKELRGYVRDWTTGTPLKGASLQAGDYQTTTDAEGFYRLELGETDVYTVTCSNEGYYSRTSTFDLTGYDYKTVNCKLKPVLDVSIPAITDVTSKYGNTFLSGLTVMNEYTVSVDWRGEPGTVKFELNGTVYQSPGTATGATRTFNMGTDFIAGTGARTNMLKITAYNAAGGESIPAVLRPLVVPIPGWATDLGSFGKIKPDKGLLVYTLDASWPSEPIKIQIDEETLGSTLWTAWNLVPIVGGRVFGIPPTQTILAVEAKTDGSGSVLLGGSTGFKAAGQEITGKIGGKGNLEYKIGEGFAWKGASLVLGTEGTIKKEVGPVTLIPALEKTVSLPVIGRPLKWFNEKAKIEGTVKIGGELDLQVISETGKLGFHKTEGTLTDEVGVGLSCGVSKLKTEVSGGGTAKITWQFPADPGYLKQLESEIKAKISITTWLFTKDFEASQPFSYPESASASSLLKSPESATLDLSDFKPVSRDFLNSASYSRFLPESGRAPMSVETQALIAEGILVQNVYPYSEPVIAEHDGKLGIAYVYFDPADTTLQATEIYFTYYNGETYSEPHPIKNDSQAEFAPTLAFDQDGKIVAAWERVRNENFTGETILEMAQNLEIVFSVFDPSTGQWTEPLPLTDNSYLDHSPMVKRGTDGSLLLMWQSNEGGELIGTSDSPSRLHYALWNGTHFGAAQTISQSFQDCISFSAAYRGPDAIVAYARDMDGDLSTDQDQELFYLSFDGSLWSVPVRLTDDEIPDVNPRVLYRTDGIAELIWLKGTSITRLDDWTSGAYETIRDGSVSVTFTDFAVTADSQDRLLVLWQDRDEKGSDLFFSLYDREAGLWSGDLRLTDDNIMEKDFSVLFSADGKLHAVYNGENLDTSATDLYHSIYELSQNLTLPAAGLRVEPANPSPGESVTLVVTVENSGDIALAGVGVNFYLGDPNASGQLIGAATVTPTPLAAGKSGEASLAWTVPSSGEQITVYAMIDPDGLIAEADETDNLVSLSVVNPDLVAIQCRLEEQADGSVNVIAVVDNAGEAAADDVEILYRANGVDVALRSVPRILPGARVEVMYTMWRNIDFSGLQSLMEIAVDPENTITEANKDNNTAFASISQISLSTASEDFGGIAVGTQSRQHTLVITNTGVSAITLGTITITGDKAAFFTILNDALSGVTLEPGESGTIDVSFSALESGAQSASLIIPCEGTETDTIAIPLAATGIVKGDVNGDGTVDISDLIAVLALLTDGTGNVVYTAADSNGDGRIGSAEAIFILQALSGN